MIVKVLYFASFREVAGVSKEAYELEEGSTLESLQNIILTKHPELKAQWDLAIVSVNRKYCRSNTILTDGAEVGVLPPISGG